MKDDLLILIYDDMGENLPMLTLRLPDIQLSGFFNQLGKGYVENSLIETLLLDYREDVILNEIEYCKTENEVYIYIEKKEGVEE